jgi:hypothetical protein
MYALVDTQLEDQRCFGRILSIHRAIATAEGSDLRLQRWAKREGQVLSTIIVQARPATEHKDLRTMFWAFHEDWQEVSK